MRRLSTALGTTVALLALTSTVASASVPRLARSSSEAHAQRLAAREARDRAALELCGLTVTPPRSIGRDLLGAPAYGIAAKLTCPASHWNDVRLCPQQLVNGAWQFVPGSGGWAAGSGTCRDADWWNSLTTGMTSQFTDTPGQQYRTYARAWVQGSVLTSTSTPWVGI